MRIVPANTGTANSGPILLLLLLLTADPWQHELQEVKIRKIDRLSFILFWSVDKEVHAQCLYI
jgi:hypothetical protein